MAILIFIYFLFLIVVLLSDDFLLFFKHSQAIGDNFYAQKSLTEIRLELSGMSYPI